MGNEDDIHAYRQAIQLAAPRQFIFIALELMMPADTRKEQIAREKTLHCKRNIVLYMYDLSVRIGNKWEFGKRILIALAII